MRRLSIALAVSVLTACQVSVEGAACTTPRTADECPSGQACGLDGKCSVRAAACVAETPRPGDRACRGAQIVEFRTASDRVCGAWEPVADCGSDALVCAESGMTASCACPDPGTSFWFDAVDGGRAPREAASNGASGPPGCRFGSLDEAVAAANRIGGGASAVAAAESADERVYDVTSVVLEPGVALMAAPGDHARHVLRVTSLPSPESAAVALRGNGARLVGFTIRNEGANTGRAVEVECDDGVAILTAVTVEGGSAGAQLAEGVHVGGRCDVASDGLIVTGVSGPGVLVDTGGVNGSKLDRGDVAKNGEGVHLRNGTLALDGVTVRENARTGVLAGEGATQHAELDVQGSTFTANGDSGIVAFNLTRLRLASNVVTGNTGVTARSSASRLVGGLVLRGNPPPELVFEGNVVSGNRGDQVIVYGTSSASTTWNLDPGKCEVRNTFGCYDASGYGLAAVDCIVTARYASWQNTIPTTNGRDFRAFGSAQIDAGEATDTFCAAAPVCGVP